MDGLTRTFYATGAMAALSVIVMIAVMLTAAMAGAGEARADAAQPVGQSLMDAAADKLAS